MQKRESFTILYFIMLTAVFVRADIIDITLESNTPYISGELESYLQYVKASYEPLIGFNGVNSGDGTGNGADEIVAFSFIFNPVDEIDNACLTIELTPHGTETDELLFADNFSLRGEGWPGVKFYGNTSLKQLSSGMRTSVTFDLMRIDYTDPFRRYLGTDDLSVYLHDGDFNVVYADDAIIHSARLRINAGLPIPPVPQQPPCPVPEADVYSYGIACLILTVLFMLFDKRQRLTEYRDFRGSGYE